MQKLIDLWRDSEAPWELRHVARNLALDGKGLTIDHPDLKTCGDRLDSQALLTLEVELEKLIEDNVVPGIGRKSTEEWARALDDAERELQKRASTVRRKLDETGIRPDTRVDADSDRLVPLVRYVSCLSIHRYWFGGAGTAQEAIEKKLREPYRMEDDQSAADAQIVPKVSLVAEGEPVWVAPGGSDAPHRDQGLATGRSRDRVIEFARLMGLPGFATEDGRTRGLGMIAVMYDLPERELRIPTVLEGMQPYFFPALRGEGYGRVASLSHDFDAPWERNDTNSTIREWVHENKPASEVKPTVELVGWYIY